MLCHALNRFAREDVRSGKRKSHFDEDPDNRRVATHKLWTEYKTSKPKEIERGWHWYEMGKTKGIWPTGWYWFDGRKKQRKEDTDEPIEELEAQVSRMAVSGSAASSDSK